MENLNNINNKKEDEFKAKEILVQRFPKRYKGLISNESPEFVGKNVGLEITNAVDENEREIKSLLSKTHTYSIPNKINEEQISILSAEKFEDFYENFVERLF